MKHARGWWLAGGGSLWLLLVAGLHTMQPHGPGSATPPATQPIAELAHLANGPSVSDASGVPAEESPFAQVRRLAEENPAEAAKLLGEWSGPWPPELAAAVASAWGKKDPASAAVWARNQPVGAARDETLFSLSADWAVADPLAAADGALALLPEPRQGEFLKVVAMQWARQDPDSALAWAGGLAEGLLRDNFMAGLSCTLAETSPAQAAGLVAAMTPGKLQDEAALTVVLEWGRQQPEAATDWVKQFPAGTVRQSALESLGGLWAESSESVAPCPLLDWPEGPERDRAIRHVLDQVLESEAGRAVELLPAITDADLRQEETERVAQYWLMQDRQAASQWLAQASLTPATKDRLYAAQAPSP